MVAINEVRPKNYAWLSRDFLCPWCGFQLQWSEWSCRRGSEGSASCMRGKFWLGVQIIGGWRCGWRGSVVRVADGGLVIVDPTPRLPWRQRLRSIV